MTITVKIVAVTFIMMIIFVIRDLERKGLRDFEFLEILYYSFLVEIVLCPNYSFEL